MMPQLASQKQGGRPLGHSTSMGNTEGQHKSRMEENQVKDMIYPLKVEREV